MPQLFPSGGLGDVLQWARFVPAVAEVAQAPIELVVPPELARLVRRLPHVAEMIPLSRWDATDAETPPAVASGCSDLGASSCSELAYFL